MAVKDGLCDLSQPDQSQEAGLLRRPPAKMWLQMPLDCATVRTRAGGIWLVSKEGYSSRIELDPVGTDSNLHVTSYSVFRETG